MDVDTYQTTAASTAIYEEGTRRSAAWMEMAGDDSILRLNYVALKLNGEAGEVAEHVGKAIRDDGGQITDERREALLLELGDVLWYCAAIATELEADLSMVMLRNMAKLSERQAKGKLRGSGSNR